MQLALPISTRYSRKASAVTFFAALRLQLGLFLMALFERETDSDELVSGTDAGTRALSVTAVENDFVEGVYDKLAKVYDLVFGPTLHPGRLRAIQRMDIQPDERVLEVGVGTGINLSL